MKQIAEMAGTRRRRGFTLTEMMISVGIFSMILAGTAPVFVMCVRSWQLTSVQVLAAQKASFATERLVYGVGLSYGLRSAVADSVLVSSNAAGWNISYRDVVGNSNAIRYVAGSRQLTYKSPDLATEVQIADCIVSAIYSNSPAGIFFRITSRVDDGRWNASNTVATFVAYRN